MSAQARGYSDIDAPYNQSGNSNWLEKQESRGKRSRWIVIGSVLGLVGLIAIGVALGVTLSKKSSSKTSSSSTSGVVNQTDPNDPSTFEKNPNLHQSFYGIAYTPEGSQYPACGNSLDQVITDIQLLSQLTTRIRLYGADCNQSALVLEAIKQTKVNLTVWLANYNIPTDDTPYTRQKAAIQSAIQTYGTDHIGGVTVGNEYMLNYLNANGATDPNSAVGNQGAALLINDINDTRYMLGNMSLSKTPPVGTAEAGSYFNTLVLQDVDYGMSNVHPWFANVSIDQSAAWTWEFFEEQNVQPAAALSNTPQMYIAETGWPSNSSDAGNESNGPSTASTANLQTFIDTFVCQANANGTEYFYFEYFDEIWKDIQFGGVEGWWGLFYSNRTLKPITIPDCQSP
ncbi:glycoside hydrolase family 17 protein [Neolentinus lepideus HHB14362 ss-1]|uniref:glucan endo-1,3-beta-D-glucosidase n=1 Tax=Neolentinus lepideus HHB14362 ss-1 TaxID=1314782 RepID=A0A165N0G1_9AGAM|nr:glycoside hydrolase family 17 protein [Neolentinus lepideus HHB14362 ss-1]